MEEDCFAEVGQTHLAEYGSHRGRLGLDRSRGDHRGCHAVLGEGRRCDRFGNPGGLDPRRVTLGVPPSLGQGLGSVRIALRRESGRSLPPLGDLGPLTFKTTGSLDAARFGGFGGAGGGGDRRRG